MLRLGSTSASSNDAVSIRSRSTHLRHGRAADLVDAQRVRVRAVASAVAVLTLANAGVASAAPTKSEFIRKGDALCTDVARQLVPIRQRAQAAQALPESQKWAAAAAIWQAQIAIQKRFNERLRAVGTPAGDSFAPRLVAGLDRGLVLARRVHSAFARRDRAALANALPAYVEFTLALNRRVRAYGFRVCGRT
jgi:hypothetical protein